MSQNYKQLLHYTTCDVADALQALGHDGYLPELQLYSPANNAGCIVGLAHTVKHVSVNDMGAPKPSEHFVDSAQPGSIIVMSTPEGSINAVWGGLMSTRAKYLGVQGVVIDGRCRDLDEHRAMAFPASVPIDICRTTHSATVRIHPGDIIMADGNGVVRVRPEWLAEIIDLCEQQTKVDERCLDDLRAGHSIQATFAKHRGQ
ncbi:ribonuclease E inhibitor RraA/Dimethylmenaquinone methyltransferase [Syncephalis pseudoplumigaleata]|uniref:Ribonuclease E inhibitor RraA/Dimethylmenaquinone methyltransferase n=1 Tax=Syncephalis pseudoplumigaleata TaxID=1712513 RepID=A0A4V1J166_9FUNG|nr:ribonuclease E inhibitor RraA/Dimethylmenaquinone methyltransferase [Syncephalis pseudoplumigaleata]|eukprot:RKP23989.1 ribonuclease E inhibitor RraA/Dimethylmenaquinone methyltransferase [Syncephalis pseudoplumigaleata]